MMNEKQEKDSIWQRILTKQWSFFWAGIAFGLAQIIYMIATWYSAVQRGRTPVLDPITVTSDLGRMFRTLEVTIYKIFHLPDFQLYGASIDGIPSTGGAFVPGVGWQLIGMIIGGLLVALAEREFRTWVKYPPRVLFISFLGGVLFSYGTRLAGGCTLNHLIGGIPLMSIHSTVTIVFMAIGGLLAFYLMGKLSLAPYFKHQETLSYVKLNDPVESITYDPNYRPTRSALFWITLIYIIFLVGVTLWAGLFNPEYVQHLKDGKLVAYNKSVADRGLFFALMMLAAGIIAGFGMAKSGYGTECALVSLETGKSMTKNDSFYARLGVPRITRTLMRGYLPIIGLTATWVVMLAFIVPVWIFTGVAPGFESGIKEQLTLGNVIGGVLLGMGAVMLIGCEIRSYMRVGLGYLNTWVGFVGFAIGYLPYTLFYEQHNTFFYATRVTETFKWYQLFFPNNEGLQKAMLFVWWIILIAFLLYLLRVGAKQIGLTQKHLVDLSTEDIQRTIDEVGKTSPVINGVPVPEPAKMPSTHNMKTT